MNLESGVLQIHLEDIIPNRFQPRLQFDKDSLKELSDSIKEHGIIQPLVLRKLGNKYEIIAGERRYKAATMAGLTTVPAVIANLDDNKAAEVAIVENVQRKDLTAIEEARSYKNLLDKGYLTQEQLAKRMGLSQPAVANKLRLLNLDEEVQQALLEEKISERHARTLLTLKDKEAQKEWLHKIINERLTVRALDTELKKLKSTNEEMDDEPENDEVPLVSSTKNINEIRANAMDINAVNKKMSTDEMMEPQKTITEEIETMTFEDEEDNSDKPQPMNIEDDKEEMYDEMNIELEEDNNFKLATSIPESNILIPESTSSFIPQDNIITSNDSKFFNFSFDEPKEENEEHEEPIKGEFEVFGDELVNENDSFIEEDSKPEENIQEEETINFDFNSNPNNKFFRPMNENSENFIFEEKEKTTEIDPMDAVEKFTPEFKEKEIESQEINLKTAINKIRDCVQELGDQGLYINVEEIDFDKNYQITIQIDKDN